MVQNSIIVCQWKLQFTKHTHISRMDIMMIGTDYFLSLALTSWRLCFVVFFLSNILEWFD